MTNSNRSRGGQRPGAGRKPDPDKRQRGRAANLRTLGLPGNIALTVVNAIIGGDEDTVDELIECFVYKRHRGEARAKLREAASLRMDSGRALSDETGDRIAEIIGHVETLMNPQQISAYSNQSVAGVEPVIDGRTEEREEIRQSKIDLVKRAAGEERGFWRWIRDLRHKRATDSLAEEDQHPPDEKQARLIASDYTGSGEKK